MCASHSALETQLKLTTSWLIVNDDKLVTVCLSYYYLVFIFLESNALLTDTGNTENVLPQIVEVQKQARSRFG